MSQSWGYRRNEVTPAAVALRLGEDLPSDYGPPRLRPALPGSDYFRPSDWFGWHLFVGAEGRLMVRNIFLDGNTFEDSHSVDKYPLVFDLQAGIEVDLGKRVRIAYTNLWRSRELSEQEAASRSEEHTSELQYLMRNS